MPDIKKEKRKNVKSNRPAVKNTKKTTRKGFQKGQSGNPAGRPKGSKNKTPARLVEQILQIGEQLTLEGKGLLECARQNPSWFFEKILSKVVPKAVDIDLGATDDSRVTFEIIKRFELPGEKDNTV